jgi:predicted nucleotidyltransferase
MSLTPVDSITVQYAQQLKNSLGPRLHEIWLFGSRARGDFKPESDYDLIIVADGDEDEVHGRVVEESYAIMCEYSALMGALTFSPEQWEQEKKTSIGRTVLREGVKVYGTH